MWDGEGEKTAKEESPLGMGWDGMSPTLVYNEPLKMTGRQLSQTRWQEVWIRVETAPRQESLWVGPERDRE